MNGRSSFVLLVLTGALLFLLPVLAVLQYHWLGRLSEGERERMQANVRAAAAQFAEAFTRDFEQARTVFQAPQPERLPEGLADLLVQWQTVAAHPGLIDGIYYVHARPPGEPALQVLDPATGAVEEADWSGLPGEIQSLFERLYRGDGTVVLRTGFDLDDGPVLVIPQFRLLRAGPGPAVPQLSHILLTIDPSYLRDVYLPDLAERHFTHDGRSEYNLAVHRAGDPDRILFSSLADPAGADFEAPDASVPLSTSGLTRSVAVRSAAYRYRFETGDPPEAVPSEVRAEAGGPGDPGEKTVRVMDFRAEVTTSLDSMHVAVEAERAPGAAVVAFLHGDSTAAPDSAVSSWFSTLVAPGEEPWRLAVVHQAGSLDAAVGRARRRNLGVSFGILLLLGLSGLLLVAATRREQQTARQQMEFVAGVTHELRTPLAVIRSAGENLADGIVHDPEQTARYGRLIRDEGRRLSGMVEQTLELAGIRSGGRVYDLRPVPVESVVEQALSGTSHLLAERGFSLDRIGRAPDVWVEADAAALQSALENLIQNAVKYSGRSRRIEVGVSQASGAGGREVAVTVRDFGLGIAAADAARVFEPFYRAQAVRHAQIKGSGLGLSLVRTVVERHGGRVELDSAPGRGSAFTIRLPVHTNATPPA